MNTEQAIGRLVDGLMSRLGNFRYGVTGQCRFTNE